MTLPTSAPVSRAAGLLSISLVLWCRPVATGQPQMKFTLQHSYVLDVASPTFTPDGKRLMTPAYDEIVFWDTGTGKEVGKWGAKSLISENPLFNRSGKSVYFWDRGALVGYEVGTGKAPEALKLDQDLSKRETWKSIESVAITADDKLVIVGLHGDKVLFWDVDTGKTRDLPAHPGTVLAVRLSPDGKRVLVTYAKGVEGRFRLSEVGSGTVLHEGAWIEYCRAPIGFSPDGQTVAWGGRVTLSNAPIVRMVDPLSGKVKADLLGHKDDIESLAFSPDGKYVATGSADRTARIWDASTGRSLAELLPGGRVRGVRFSPDSRLLVTGSSDPRAAKDPRTIKVWELNAPK